MPKKSPRPWPQKPPQRTLHINTILTSHIEFTKILPAICRPTRPPVSAGWWCKSAIQGLSISVVLVNFQRHHTLANPGWLLSRNYMYRYAIQAKAGIRVSLLAISPFPIVASYLKALDLSATVTFPSGVSIVTPRLHFGVQFEHSIGPVRQKWDRSVSCRVGKTYCQLSKAHRASLIHGNASRRSLEKGLAGYPPSAGS